MHQPALLPLPTVAQYRPLIGLDSDEIGRAEEALMGVFEVNRDDVTARCL
jgi:hypothetical protein